MLWMANEQSLLKTRHKVGIVRYALHFSRNCNLIACLTRAWPMSMPKMKLAPAPALAAPRLTLEHEKM